MSFPRRTFAVVAAGAAFVGGYAGSALLSSSAAEPAPATMGCENWAGTYTQKECFAAGVIRNVALYNLQGAAQFCKWRPANPGEWTRLKGYASSGIAPQEIVTWFGASIRNQLEAYFAAGAPAFTIEPNTAPNRCKTPIAAPIVQGVTPGQTDATITVGP